MVKREVPVVFYREGDYWLARAVGVEVATSGDSLEDAKRAVQEGLELYFEDSDEAIEVTSARLDTVIV